MGKIATGINRGPGIIIAKKIAGPGRLLKIEKVIVVPRKKTTGLKI